MSRRAPPPEPPQALAPGSPGTRIVALDGLRGLAVLLVIWFHSLWAIYVAMPRTRVEQLYYRVMTAGWTGVDLFFVLSGFLITGLLLDARGAPDYYRRFFVRRSLRILPLHYAFLLVMIGLAFVFRGGPDARIWQGAIDYAPWYALFGANVLFSLPSVPDDWHLLTHLWSLAVEEQFYLVWPFVVALCAPRRLGWICVAIIIGVPLLRLGVRLADTPISRYGYYALTPLRADVLAAGALLAVLWRSERGRATMARWAGPALLIGAAGVTALFARMGTFKFVDAPVQLVGFSASVLLFAGLVALALRPGSLVARAMGGAGWLRSIGKYSYAMYLVHVPLVHFLGKWLPVPDLGRRASPVPWDIAFFVGLTLVSYAIARVTWVLIERPFLTLRDRGSRDAGHAVAPKAATTAVPRA